MTLIDEKGHWSRLGILLQFQSLNYLNIFNQFWAHSLRAATFPQNDHSSHLYPLPPSAKVTIFKLK
jgi:hypothetical protein